MKNNNADGEKYADSKGSISDKKLANASASYTNYRKYMRAGERLALDRALIKGQMDGNPPWSRDEQKKYGRAWEANVNFRRTGSQVKRNATSLWNMFVESVYQMMRLRQVAKLEDDPNDYSGQVSEAFTETVRMRWKSFSQFAINRFMQMSAFGNGPAFWSDKYCWKSEWMKAANILVRDDAPTEIEKLDIVYIRDEKPAGFLYKKINASTDEEKENVALAGWNRSGVILAIGKMAEGGHKEDKYYMSTYESLQQVQKNKGFTDFALNKVRMVHELETNDDDGSVTHRIFFEQEDTKIYMYEYDAEYESMDKALSFIFFDCGDGYYRGSKGLGTEVYTQNDLFDKVMCHFFTGASISSGLLLQSQNTDTDDKGVKINKGGGYTVIPSSVNITVGSFAPNIGGLISALDVLKTVQSENINGHASTQEGVQSTERTRYQVRADIANEAEFRTDQSAWYFSQWERWIEETFNRLINPEYPEEADGYSDHEFFVKECVRLGVPEKILKSENFRVIAVKAIGGGSQAQRLSNTEDMVSKLPMIQSQEGQNYVMREWFSARAGWQATDIIVPKLSTTPKITEDTQEAGWENNFIALGVSTEVAESDIHVTHLQKHDEFAQGMIGSIQNGGDIGKITIALDMVIRHMVEHLLRIHSNPNKKGPFKAYTERVKQYDAIFKKLQKQYVAQQQQVQAEQQAQAQKVQALQDQSTQLDYKHAEEMERIRLEDEREKLKIRNYGTNQSVKNEKQFMLKVKQAISEINRKDALAAAEAKRKEKGK